MSGTSLLDTQHPRRKWSLAFHTVAHAVGVAVVVSFYRPTVPSAVIVLMCLCLLLHAACWLVPPTRREGVWRMAELAEAVCIAVFFGYLLRGTNGDWLWVAGLVVLLHAAPVAMAVESCYREIRQWPPFTRR